LRLRTPASTAGSARNAIRVTTPSSTVKSKATLASPRWTHAAPGRCSTKTDNAAFAAPLKKCDLLPPGDALGRAHRDRCGVPGHDHVGSQQAQQPTEIATSSRSEERVDHLPVGERVVGCGLDDLGAGSRGQLARRRRRRVQHRGDGRELEAEAVMQDEGDPLARGEPVQDDPQRHAYGVSEGHLVGRVADVLRDLDPFPLVGHRHFGTEPVQAQARGHRGQPAGEVRDLLLGALQ